MEKVITIENSAVANLLLALTAMGVTPSKTEAKTDVTEITVELTDAQVKAISDAFSGSDASVAMIIRDSMNKAVEFATDAAGVLVTGIAVPALSLGAKAAAGVAGIAVKATAQFGASIVNNVVDEGVKAVAGVKSNDECQKLKKSWATIKGAFSKSQSKFKIS